MQATTQLLGHAHAALDRSALMLSEMRQTLCAGHSTMGRRRRDAADEAVFQVARRYRRLVDARNEMDAPSREHFPAAWRRFFTRYDEYLEAVRDAKCALAHEEYWESLGSTAAAVASESPRPTESFP